MYKNKKILGLIPARGNSKGLAGKNTRPLSGKPLIYWSIKEAFRSRYLDRVIVSTDSCKIAALAKKYGAEVPFMRPGRLATDTAKCIDVIFHALDFMRKKGQRYDLILLLQPTSPLRSSLDIDKAVRLLFRKKAKAVVSVCQEPHSPLRSNTLPRNGCMKNFLKPQAMNRNRQDLPDFYRLNGAVMLAFCGYLKEDRGFFGSRTYAYIMPQERSVDIDTKCDLKFAEFLFKGYGD
jgi:N-acylneuraminate cytidylyltransferase/CMP-N,N'-diacetyllegionaminic acid synthase